MFKFLTAIRTKREEQQASKAEQWRELMRRAALNDDLTQAEAVKLDALHNELGFTEDLGALAADIQEHQRQSAAAGTLDKIDREVTTARKALADFDAETTRLVEEKEKLIQARAAARTKTAGAVTDAEGRHKEAAKAAAKADEIERRQWRFFDREDPAIAEAEQKVAKESVKRRRHLAHYLRDQDGRAFSYPLGRGWRWTRRELRRWSLHNRPSLNGTTIPPFARGSLVSGCT